MTLSKIAKDTNSSAGFQKLNFTPSVDSSAKRHTLLDVALTSQDTVVEKRTPQQSQTYVDS